MTSKNFVFIAAVALGLITLSSAVGAQNVAEQKGVAVVEKDSAHSMTPEGVNFQFTHVSMH